LRPFFVALSVSKLAAAAPVFVVPLMGLKWTLDVHLGWGVLHQARLSLLGFFPIAFALFLLELISGCVGFAFGRLGDFRNPRFEG
jgi:hypothetical protein